MTGPLRPMRDESDHRQTSFRATRRFSLRQPQITSGTAIRAINNRVRQSLLRDAHRADRYALGVNVGPLRDLVVSPVNAGSPPRWKEGLGLPSIDLLKVHTIGIRKIIINIFLLIGVPQNPLVTR